MSEPENELWAWLKRLSRDQVVTLCWFLDSPTVPPLYLKHRDHVTPWHLKVAARVHWLQTHPEEKPELDRLTELVRLRRGQFK